MRFSYLLGLTVLIVNAIVDYRIYRILKNIKHRKVLAKLHAILSLLLMAMLIFVICMPKRRGSDPDFLWVMWVLFAYVSVYLSKYIYIIFRLLSQIPRLWNGRRWRPLSIFGFALAVVVFMAVWWGALVNRYNIQVVDVDVPVKGLPEAFEGFRIAQISDLHVGSYGTDTTFVSHLVDSVNALNPDMIVFTGDIVNRHSDEFLPFVSVIDRLDAPYGVFSVMGNHDYGDYAAWHSMRDKDIDVLHIKHLEYEAGLEMLNNESRWIRIGSDSIALIGVENIGDPPFKTYGDLSKAYPDISDDNIKVLLTHNPAHWDSDIADTDANVALTLSGHTHAMQVELFGISPAALRYKHWGGMYTDNKGQHLYVNIGAGTVGMLGRIGATPEITILTLRGL